MPWGFLIGCILIYVITYYFMKKDPWIDSKIGSTIGLGTLLCLLLIFIFLIIWVIISPEITLNQPTEITEISNYIILDERILYTTKDNQSINLSYREDFLNIGNTNSTHSYMEVYKNCKYTSPIASFFFGDSLIPTYYEIYIAGD